MGRFKLAPTPCTPGFQRFSTSIEPTFPNKMMSGHFNPSTEIETFKRRYLPIVPLVLGLLNVGYVVFLAFNLPYQYFRGNEPIIFSLLFGSIHVFYTLILLLAPRFLYRGAVWLKASPWILSSLSIFILFYFYLCNRPSNLELIYCLAGFALQLLQFIACVLPTDSFLSPIFKPFQMIKVQNFLAKINLSDPNANLETAFGSPVQVPSPIYGQAPTTIRYGSQARNVLLQQATEVPVAGSAQAQAQVYPIYHHSDSDKQPIPTPTPTSSLASIPFAQTPPPYTTDLPSYDSISHQQSGNSQFSEKK